MPSTSRGKNELAAIANAQPTRTLMSNCPTIRPSPAAVAPAATAASWKAALRRCAAQSPTSESFLRDGRFSSWRWVFFDVVGGRDDIEPGDLDDPLVRARALEEW